MSPPGRFLLFLCTDPRLRRCACALYPGPPRHHTHLVTLLRKVESPGRKVASPRAEEVKVARETTFLMTCTARKGYRQLQPPSARVPGIYVLQTDHGKLFNSIAPSGKRSLAGSLYINDFPICRSFCPPCIVSPTYMSCPSPLYSSECLYYVIYPGLLSEYIGSFSYQKRVILSNDLTIPLFGFLISFTGTCSATISLVHKS